MDREHEIQCLTQAEQQIAKIDEHIKWQQEVVDIVERVSTSAEAAEGARALLTTYLEAQAQHQKIRDRIRTCLYGNTVSPWATPLLLLEAQAQHEQDQGRSRTFATLCAKSDPCSAAPLMLSAAHTRREPDDAIRLTPDFDCSPATVPFKQSIDDRDDMVIQTLREPAEDQIHLSPDCHLDSPAPEPLTQSLDDRNGIASQEQRQQDGNEIRLGLECNVDSPSTTTLEPSNDHQNKVTAGTGTNQTSVQLEAKPGHVWRMVRAAAVWISDLVSRHICRTRS